MHPITSGQIQVQLEAASEKKKKKKKSGTEVSEQEAAPDNRKLEWCKGGGGEGRCDISIVKRGKEDGEKWAIKVLWGGQNMYK
jgi:hypothetical protein